MRVKVFSEGKYLGLGEIVDHEEIKVRDRVVKVPVIRLDDGRIVKGYECWWIPKEEADKIEKKILGKVVFNDKD